MAILTIQVQGRGIQGVNPAQNADARKTHSECNTCHSKPSKGPSCTFHVVNHAGIDECCAAYQNKQGCLSGPRAELHGLGSGIHFGLRGSSFILERLAGICKNANGALSLVGERLFVFMSWLFSMRRDCFLNYSEYPGVSKNK